MALPFPLLTLAVKVVLYQAAGQAAPVVTPESVRASISDINEIYATCSVRFELEKEETVDPAKYGLRYRPSTMAELTAIRTAFDERGSLLVVGTGAWDHAGGLGADGANAWTAMPGSLPSGAIMEASVASNSGMLAHELGHALNLDHVHSRANVMNPVIYRDSRALAAEQCESVRKTALSQRAAALRSGGSMIVSGLSSPSA